jgi:hypothetical protein
VGVVDSDGSVTVAMRSRWWGGDGTWASSMVVVVVEGEFVCLLMMPKSSVGKCRRSIWALRIPFHSFWAPFRPRDSWNHSGGIRIPFKIPPELFYQYGRSLCQN